MITEVRGRPRWWQIGRFRFDAVTRRLEDGGAGTTLPSKAAEVLLLLAERRGDVVLRDELVREVWDGNAYTGTRALTQIVWRLRQVLDGGENADDDASDAASAIRTVSKTGYQLMLPAAPLPRPSTLAAAGLEAAAEGVQAADAPAAHAAATPVAAPRRRRLALLSLGVGCLLLALGGAVWWLSAVLRPGTGVDATAPEPLTLLDGVEDFPAYSADGRRLAFVWTYAGEPQRIRIVDLRAPQTPPLDIPAEAGFRLARPMWLGTGALAYARARDGGADCEVVAVDLQTRAQRRLTADCRYEPNLPFVDASPDGRWLVLSRPVPGAPATSLVLHDLKDGSERVLTHPGPALDDGQISFSRSGRQVAFVRGSVAVGDVWVVDVASGRETRLTHDQAPIGGLSWLADDSGIVFSSVRDGSFADWRVDAAGGTPTLFSRAQAATNLAAVPGEPDAVAASLHRFADAILVYAPGGDAPQSTLASSGRNLYAQACGDAKLVFLSTRGGRVAVWASDLRGEHPRALPMPEGTPDTPACSASGDGWAVAMRAPGAAFDSLVIGHLNGNDAPLVVSPSASLNNVAWSHDGQSLIVASDRENGWDLWRFDIASRRFSRLTDDHGSFGREVQTSAGRWLYYARLDQRGLWRRALDAEGRPAGPPQPVTERLDADDWGNWQWHDGALWLLERTSAGDRLLHSDELGRDAQVARSFPARQVRRFRSMSIAESGTLVLSTGGAPQADIVRLRGPRGTRAGG
jgi:Tol biopolymer transport system component/DNA-binding winged helix-turn-helix (wHTH) protein